MNNRPSFKRRKYRWLIYSDVDRYIRSKIAKEVKNVSKKRDDIDVLELIKFTALFVEQRTVEVVADMLVYLVSNNYKDLSYMLDYKYYEVYKEAKRISEEIVLEIKSKKHLYERSEKDTGKIIRLYKTIDSNISIIFLQFLDWIYSLRESDIIY